MHRIAFLFAALGCSAGYTQAGTPVVPLAVIIAGTGTVTGTGGLSCSSTCTVNVSPETAVSLTSATIDFAGWSGACSGTAADCAFTVADAPVTVTATFAPSVVSINPATAEVATGGETQFGAHMTNATDTSLTWSVVEGAAGGTIDGTGHYSAPATVGTFHVKAASKVNPQRAATATVSVTVFVDQAVAYQIGIDHAGQMTFPAPLVLPQAPAWSVTLPGKISYPLIAGGKVFVTTGSNDSPTPQLYALDEVTGAVVWGPKSLDNTFPWANAAYDDGKVFALNFDAQLSAFDAATGTPGFSVKLPGQFFSNAPPTASKGVVYATATESGGTLYAVSETTGAVLWQVPVENGDISSPALAGDGVFVTYPGQYYDFDPATGTPLWHFSGSVEGGGGKNAVYRGGKLYVRDPNVVASDPVTGAVLDSASGNQIATFTAVPAPAVGDQRGFFLDRGTLHGVDLSSNAILWSFSGDGTLVSAPIVINGAVFAGASSGKVYALDAATGSQLWAQDAGAPIAAPDEQNVSQPLTGLGAGEGMLVVPAGSTLTAWKLQ
jgi:outer membrane protein assembly factor BamB